MIFLPNSRLTLSHVCVCVCRVMDVWVFVCVCVLVCSFRGRAKGINLPPSLSVADDDDETRAVAASQHPENPGAYILASDPTFPTPPAPSDIATPHGGYMVFPIRNSHFRRTGLPQSKWNIIACLSFHNFQKQHQIMRIYMYTVMLYRHMWVYVSVCLQFANQAATHNKLIIYLPSTSILFNKFFVCWHGMGGGIGIKGIIFMPTDDVYFFNCSMVLWHYPLALPVVVLQYPLSKSKNKTTPSHNSNAITHSSLCWMHKQIEKLFPNQLSLCTFFFSFFFNILFHFLVIFFFYFFPPKASPWATAREGCLYTFSEHGHGTKVEDFPSKNNLYLNSFTLKVFHNQLLSAWVCVCLERQKPQEEKGHFKMRVQILVVSGHSFCFQFPYDGFPTKSPA